MTAALALGLCLLATSCKIGHSRAFDVHKDLSGLDLAYLQKQAREESTDNTQSIEGELAGFPFWFAPAVSLRFGGANALHRGDLVEPEDEDDQNAQAKAPISGYTHARGSALGLGLLTYQGVNGEWNEDGDLEKWEERRGLGWGIVYSQNEWGDTTGRGGHSTKILLGLLGYESDEKEGYLHFLWIPIPFK